jgi:hypothetical protein
VAKTKLIVLDVEDEPGAVAAATTVMSEAGINIVAIFGWGPEGVVQLGVDNPRKAMKALAAASIAHREVKAEMTEMPNKPGSLHAFLAKLAKKGVNLRSKMEPRAKAGASRLCS